MQIAETIDAQFEFRRNVRGGAQLDDYGRPADARARTKRLAIVNRHRTFAVAHNYLRTRNRRWLLRVAGKPLRLRVESVRDRADSKIHHFDRGIGCGMSKRPAMRSVKVGNESRR